MKFIVLLILFTQSAFAQLLGCKNPHVVLSLKPVKCDAQINIEEEFDIPELDLNYDAVELIFKKGSEQLGADSSGGGVQPQAGTASAQTRISKPEFDFPVNLSCQIQLTSDGQKRYQVQSFDHVHLSEKSPKKVIGPYKHYLSDGINKYPLPGSSVIPLKRTLLKLINPKDGKNLKLRICEQDYACAETKSSFDQFLLQTHLTTFEKLDGVTITRDYDVTCLLF